MAESILRWPHFTKSRMLSIRDNDSRAGDALSLLDVLNHVM